MDRVSTIMAVIMDIYVHRQQTRRGVYRLHDLDSGKRRVEATRGPFTDDDHVAHPRESEAWEAPRPSIGPYNETAAPMSGGYAVPDQQFDYDTQYHGGHEQRSSFYGS